MVVAVLLLAAGPAPLRLTGRAASARPGLAVGALPPGFVDEVVLDNLGIVTAAAFAPDGRLFLAEKAGQVRLAQNGVLLPQAFVDISAQVNNNGDRGLNGLALHPDFPATPYVYLWFTYDPPDLLSTNNHDTPDGDGARVSRLIRVSVDPANPNQALPGSEVVLLGTNSTLANIGAVDVYDDEYNAIPPPSCGLPPAYIQDCLPSDSSAHGVGTVLFGPDGALYVGHGDGSNFIQADARALRAQSLDSLAGKILRIDPLTGYGYPDNPFYDGDVTSNRSRVWAYGLRNPFRFSFRPDGQIILGDVGWDSWEELNVGNGGNFGWPCYEGALAQPRYAAQAGTAAACQALYALGPAAVSPPIYAYGHVAHQGASVIGGLYATGSPYPPDYQAGYFFADYGQKSISVLRTGPGEAVTVELFEQLSLESDPGPVQLLRGPDANLYYLGIGWPNSALHRLRFVAGGNTPPVAHLTAAPTNGGLPLAVSFSAAGSADPDAQPLTYAWAWGDGGFETGLSAVHTYTLAGNYQAVLTVSDSQGLTATAQIAISAGNHAPVATISTPLTGTLVSAGQVVTFTGAASDVEDGALSGPQLQWSLLVHHLNHLHPNVLPPTSGVSGSFVAPDHGDNTWLELCLTATDLGGLSASDCRPIWPRTGLVQLRTVPPGLELLLAGTVRHSPYDVAVQENAVRTVQATQPGWTLVGWNDGLPGATRTLTGTLATQTLTATYTNTAPVAVAAADPVTGWAPLPVTFTATASYDPDSPTVTYHWDFGDGGGATTATATHVYNSGVYIATLTVTDLGGLIATTQFVIAPNARIWLPVIGR